MNLFIIIIIELDDDFIYSDYLNFDVNYKNEINCVYFVGDEILLYGILREELLFFIGDIVFNDLYNNKFSLISFFKE